VNCSEQSHCNCTVDLTSIKHMFINSKYKAVYKHRPTLVVAEHRNIASFGVQKKQVSDG